MPRDRRLDSPPVTKPLLKCDIHGPLALTIVGAQDLISHRLPPSGEVLIGRVPPALVTIDDPSVSRRHARLVVGSSLTITDLNSTNGTRIRGRRIEPGEYYPVAVGEPIEIGSATIVAHALRPDSRRRETEIHLAPVAPDREEFESADSVVVSDPAMVNLYKLTERVAASNISVMLLGETGTGKEILAEAVHRLSPRAAKPFLRLNCASVPENLLESELFGHEKGSFSGAISAKPGLFEIAGTGTVFLDEIGEMPVSLQAKLLRVIDEQKVMRVGGLKAKPIDVRFISATNRDLEQEIARGGFRQDLFYRLNGMALRIPPLRKRAAEIEPLARLFLARAVRPLGLPPPRLSPQALEMLNWYAWPGNIRELKNVIDRAVLMCNGGEILLEHLPVDTMTDTSPLAETIIHHHSPDAARRQQIIDALTRCAGNQTHAAKLLGISRATFVARMSQYGLPRPRKRAFQLKQP
jgi:transcriptional regulator with PAS, ATPase and Fis domain